MGILTFFPQENMQIKEANKNLKKKKHGGKEQIHWLWRHGSEKHSLIHEFGGCWLHPAGWQTLSGPWQATTVNEENLSQLSWSLWASVSRHQAVLKATKKRMQVKRVRVTRSLLDWVSKEVTLSRGHNGESTEPTDVGESWVQVEATAHVKDAGVFDGFEEEQGHQRDGETCRHRGREVASKKCMSSVGLRGPTGHGRSFPRTVSVHACWPYVIDSASFHPQGLFLLLIPSKHER